MNNAIILLGSNIEPGDNIQYALGLLNQIVTIENYSSLYKTPAYGSIGPDFLNIAVHILTNFSLFELKRRVHTVIENTLGRIRVTDKNAPRTMDIDTIVYNGKVIDEDVWTKVFVAAPVSDLSPNLFNSKIRKSLLETAQKLKSSNKIELVNPPVGFLPA